MANINKNKRLEHLVKAVLKKTRRVLEARGANENMINSVLGCKVHSNMDNSGLIYERDDKRIVLLNNGMMIEFVEPQLTLPVEELAKHILTTHDVLTELHNIIKSDIELAIKKLI